MSSAVVLSSGGINSATVLEIALQAHRPDAIHMVSFKYGSNHNEQERLASLDLYHFYRDRNEPVTWDQIELPDLFYGERPPLLNTNLLLMAATCAVINDSSYVYTGMHNERLADLRSLEAVIDSNSNHTVQLKFPLVEMIKGEILKRALALEVPANLTWSCRKPVKQHMLPLIHCGICLPCIDRVNGFKRVGYIDPVPYAIELEWYGLKHWPVLGDVQLRDGELPL